MQFNQISMFNAIEYSNVLFNIKSFNLKRGRYNGHEKLSKNLPFLASGVLF